MIEGPLLKKILFFALPLAASSIIQQLFNSADIAVVGRFSSSQALAAVGSNGPVINILVLLFTGLSVGANVLIAQYIGQGEKKKVSEAVHTVILLSVASGVFLLILGQAIAPPLLRLMNTPDDVIDLATLYLRIYFLGMPFIMLYNFGSAVLRSIGDTKRPLYCLLASGVVNVALNLLFVIVFNMSVSGVATATVIADAISAFLVMYFLFTEKNEDIRLSIGKFKFKKEYLIRVFKIGAPAGIQGMVFSLSNICIQTSVNSFGSNAVAGSATALNFEYISYFIISAFNQTAVTFTSQNYGAGKFDRCKKVLRLNLLCGCLICAAVSLTFVIGSSFFVKIYTTDENVIHYALIRMTHVMLIEFVTGFYEITGAALRGIGHSLLPAVLTIFGSVVFRIVWIYTIFTVFKSFESLMIVYPVSWVITGIAVTLSYFIISRREFSGVKSPSAQVRKL